MKVSVNLVVSCFLVASEVALARTGVERKLQGPYGEGETNCGVVVPTGESSSKGKGRGGWDRVLRHKKSKGSKSSKQCGKGSKGKGSRGEDDNVQTLFFDTTPFPDIIFGSGNEGGFFTCSREDNLELCLRAKQRFPRANPTGLWSQGDGTYIVPNGDPCDITEEPGFGFLEGYCVSTPIWSFEWSVNTNLDGSTPTRNFDDFEFELGMDADPSCDTDFDVLFPFTSTLAVPLWDHAFGTNETPNGGGTTARDTSAMVFLNLLATQNVAQQSWNYEFFNNAGTKLFFFDPNTVGTYDIYLKATDVTGECPSEYEVTIRIVTDPTQTLYDGSDPTP